MAKRNMKQIIEKTKVPHEYQMRLSEWAELADEDDFESTKDAFIYGFALGMRYQKKKGSAKK